MKKFLLFTLVLFAFSVTAFSQNNVTMNIHHKLATEDFALNMAAKNNVDHDFNVSRLQYYISEITIVHDDGQETPIEDRD